MTYHPFKNCGDGKVHFPDGISAKNRYLSVNNRFGDRRLIAKLGFYPLDLLQS